MKFTMTSDTPVPNLPANRFVAQKTVANAGAPPPSVNIAPFGGDWLGGAGSFEPRIIRSRIILKAGTANDRAAFDDADITPGIFRDGALTGAEVEVWRFSAGNTVCTHIRTDTVAAHVHRAWSRVAAVGSGTTSFTFLHDRFWKPGASSWWGVAALHPSKAQSAIVAAPTFYTAPAVMPTNIATPSNPTITLDAGNFSGVIDGGLAAPTGVALALDPDTARVTLSWTAAAGAVGYIVFSSDHAPATHAGPRFDLVGGGGKTALLPGDDLRWSIKIVQPNLGTLLRNLDYSRDVNRNFLSRFASYYQEGDGATWSWAITPHAPANPFPNSGESFYRVTTTTTTAAIRAVWTARLWTGQAGTDGQQLPPGKVMVAEVWARADGNKTARVYLNDPTAGALSFTGPGLSGGSIAAGRYLDLPLTTTWQKFTINFSLSAPYLGTDGASLQIWLYAQGVFDFDMIRVYEQGTDPTDMPPTEKARLAESPVGVLRLHTLVKSGLTPYDVTLLTNSAGVTSTKQLLAGNTLPQGLELCADLGRDPWIGIDPHLSPAEWDAVIDFMAAPAGTNQWADKRVAQGRTAPWTDAFTKIYWECGNELWNNAQDFLPWVWGVDNGGKCGAFSKWLWDRVIARATLYGAQGKFVSILGGMAASSNFNGLAIDGFPDAQHIVIAPYWQTRADTANKGPYQDSFSFRTALMGIEQQDAQQIPALVSTIAGRGKTATMKPGIYETNFEMFISSNPWAKERLLHGLAAGTRTLDSHCYAASRGYDLQAFFMAKPGGEWSSHSPGDAGTAQLPYPGWQWLEKVSQFAKGDYLTPLAVAVTTANLPAFSLNPANPAAPTLGVYLIADGARRTLVVCNRKLPFSTLPADDPLYDAADDGWQRARVDLPFRSAASLTLHRMEDDYFVHNRDPRGYIPWRRLNYDGGTAAFVAGTVSAGAITLQVANGDLVTGGTSGATGRVYRVNGTTASGSLDLYGVKGAFVDNEELRVGGAARALANGTLSDEAGELVAGQNDPAFRSGLAIQTVALTPPADCARVTLDASMGLTAQGLRPACAYMWVFEGVA